MNNEIKWEYEKIEKKYNFHILAYDLNIHKRYANIWDAYIVKKGRCKVALYGGGNHTKQWLLRLERWGQMGLVCCVIDNYTSCSHLKGIPIIREEDLVRWNVDTVWISSIDHRSEMLESVKNHYPYLSVIEPYEILFDKQQNKHEMNPFYYYGDDAKYYWFTNKVYRLSITEDRTERECISKQLIAGYYEICDWVNLSEQICYHLDNYNNTEIRSLGYDVSMLFNKIRYSLKNKSNEGGIIFLVDALSRAAVNKMYNIDSWTKKSMCFDQYFNQYPATREVIMGMFTGWEPFKDETYKDKKIEWTSSELLEWLHENGWHLVFLGANRYLNNFSDVALFEDGYGENKLLSEALFNGVCRLAEDDKKYLVVVHAYDTVHPPHLTPTAISVKCDADRYSGSLWEYESRFMQALGYTDRILNIYLKLIETNKKILTVVMGDHGLDIETEYSLYIDKSRTNRNRGQWDLPFLTPKLCFGGYELESEKIDALVSSKDFSNILLHILKKDNIKTALPHNKYIELEFVPAYDSFVKTAYDSGNYYLGMGAIGRLSKKYMYLSFEDDSEVYYEINNGELELLVSDDEKDRCRNELGINTKGLSFPHKILEDTFFKRHMEYYGKDGWFNSNKCTLS